MKIETLAKWHKYYNPICQWFVVFMMISTIIIVTTWIVNYATLTKIEMFYLANIFAGYVFLLTLTTIPFGILGIIFQFINSWTINKLQFNLSNDKKLILLYLILRKHKSKTLNLELEKIIHIYNKQSNVYQEFNETDFPCLNKMFRRFKKMKTDSSDYINKSTTHNDLNKLNSDYFDTPKLLTVNHVDNELNNLINNQFANLNSQKDIDCVKMKHSSRS